MTEETISVAALLGQPVEDLTDDISCYIPRAHTRVHNLNKRDHEPSALFSRVESKTLHSIGAIFYTSLVGAKLIFVVWFFLFLSLFTCLYVLYLGYLSSISTSLCGGSFFQL